MPPSGSGSGRPRRGTQRGGAKAKRGTTVTVSDPIKPKDSHAMAYQNDSASVSRVQGSSKRPIESSPTSLDPRKRSRTASESSSPLSSVSEEDSASRLEDDSTGDRDTFILQALQDHLDRTKDAKGLKHLRTMYDTQSTVSLEQEMLVVGGRSFETLNIPRQLLPVGYRCVRIADTNEADEFYLATVDSGRLSVFSWHGYVWPTDQSKVRVFS
jgi:hypothetical protein